MSQIHANSSYEVDNVFQVVGVGLKLYRDRIGCYLRISLMSFIWWLLGFVVFGASIYIPWKISESPGVEILIRIVGLLFLLYSIAKSVATASIISRLAFATLSDRVDLTSQAGRRVMSNLWSMFFLPIIVLFIWTSVVIAAASLQFLLGYIVGLASSQPGFYGSIVGILNLALYVVGIWYNARWFVAQPVLAIEGKTNAIAAMSRSWRLSRGKAWRIVISVAIALFFPLPIYIFATIICAILSALIGVYVQDFVAELLARDIGWVWVQLGLFGACLWVLNIILIPFWQICRSVIYYDLLVRSRTSITI